MGASVGLMSAACLACGVRKGVVRVSMGEACGERVQLTFHRTL